MALAAWFGVELISGGGQAGLAERLFGAGQALWPLMVVASCRVAARKNAGHSLTLSQAPAGGAARYPA